MSETTTQTNRSGMSKVFWTAEQEGANKAFPGLTLISQVCFESGQFDDVYKPMHPINMLFPSQRVGLREPQNEERRKIEKLLPHEVATSHQYSCRSIYEYYCKQFHVPPNSGFLKTLNDKGGDFFSTTKLSATWDEVKVIEQQQENNSISRLAESSQQQTAVPDAYDGSNSIEQSNNASFGHSSMRSVGGMKAPRKGAVTTAPAGLFISERGILPILELAALLPNLTTIELPSNGLKNESIEWLAHFALQTKVCPKLSSLDLRDNRITLGAGKCLLQVAEKRKSMLDIKIEGTRIEAAVARKIASQLSENRNQHEAVVGKVASLR